MKHNHATFKLLVLLFVSVFSLSTVDAQTPKSQNTLGEMILQNQKSLHNAVYQVPCGTVNSSSYITSAITVGDGVVKPLSYFSTRAPISHYVNYSLTTTSVERGKSFQLVLTANENVGNAVNVYAFADWNRDGEFETVLGDKQISVSADNDISGIAYTVNIPETAELGKTRIRVYFSNSTIASPAPTAPLASGYIYDFVLFTAENTGTASTALVSVSSNNIAWGNAIVKTESPSSDGMYPINSQVTVEAIAESFSDFVGWSNGTKIVSTDTEYTFTVNSSIYLIAVFNTLTTVLETPQSSTSDQPIWYQIKNAQTDSRLDRFIAYDTAIPAGYISNLRIEKPEDLTDKFLWRLQPSSNGMVKLENRGSNMQIMGTGNNVETLTVSAVGSDFMVSPSGSANGSFSVKYNNVGTSLLNGDMAFTLVLYNGGVGTGSGWYFYRVPTDLLSSVSNQNITNHKVYANHDFLFIEGMESGTLVNVYNMLGHSLLKYRVRTDNDQVAFSQKGFFFVLAQTKSGQSSTFKIIQ